MNLRWVALAVLVVCLQRGLALNFFLRSGEETCFSQDVIRGENVYAEWAVTPAGSTVGVTVRDPLGTTVLTRGSSGEGKFAYTSIENGEYKACFSNQAEHGENQKSVALKFTTGAEAKSSAGGARKKNLKPLEMQVKHLEEVVAGIRHDEAWMSQKQEKMRRVNDSTASQILWFNVFSLLILVAASGAQIWYLRRYFRSKKLVTD